MSTVYTSWSSGYTPSGASTARKFRGWMDYEKYDETSTSVTYTVDAGAQLNAAASLDINVVLNGTGHSSSSGKAYFSYSEGTDWDWACSNTFTYTKGYSAVSKTFTVKAAGSTGCPTAWKNTPLTKSVTVTIPAKPSYSVTFNANGGSGAPGSQTKWYGDALVLSSSVPTRTVYIFGGWSGSNGVAYSAGGTVAAGANYNLALTAIWNPAPYTLTYNANGGSVSPTSKTVTYGATYGTLPIPIKNGYYFLGWFTDSVGGTQVFSNTVMGIGNRTIYAHWHQNPSIDIEVQPLAPYYTEGCIYEVDFSNLTLYDDANSATIRLDLGSLSQTITNEDELKIEIETTQSIDNVTPIVTLTDNIGASVRYELSPPVTVYPYTIPTINSILIERTDEDGQIQDEGTYVVVGYQLFWIGDLGPINAPSLEIDDQPVLSSKITWYKTYDGHSQTGDYLVDPITEWETVQSGNIVYGFINDNFIINDSYNITATISDTYGTSNDIEGTLPQAFFTIEFLNGGHGIAFGQPASEEGFYCAMPANFINHRGIMQSIFDLFYPIGSYYETNLPYTINGKTYNSSNLTEEEKELCGIEWFDPRFAWGGTWELEEAGRVHISAGTTGNKTYTVGETDGNKDLIVPYHTHGNDISFSVDLSGSCSISSSGAHGHTLKVGRMFTSGSNKNGVESNGTTTGTGMFVSSGDHTHTVPNHTHTLTKTGSVGYAGTPDNFIDANMPPYVVINRWHRTA